MALFEHGNECAYSYTIRAVLAVIVLAISIGIGAYFVYFCCYLKKDATRIKFGIPYSNNNLIIL